MLKQWKQLPNLWKHLPESKPPSATLKFFLHQTITNTGTLCFGERTTFVCPIDGCNNKHWETKYYLFGVNPDSGYAMWVTFSVLALISGWYIARRRLCAEDVTQDGPRKRPRLHLPPKPGAPKIATTRHLSIISLVMKTRLLPNRTYQSTDYLTTSGTLLEEGTQMV